VEQRRGISKVVISRWIKPLRDREHEAFPGTALQSDRDEEVRRLRRELGRVTRERDILKKAVRIFSEGQ
jgi:transposase